MTWVAMMVIFHPFSRREGGTGSAHHVVRSRVRRWKVMGCLSPPRLASREEVMVPHLHQPVVRVVWVVSLLPLTSRGKVTVLRLTQQAVAVAWVASLLPLASRERVIVLHLTQQVVAVAWVVTRASLGNALLPAHQQV